MGQNIILRRFSEKMIREIADSKFILKNGKIYFEQGRVKDFNFKNGVISARVLGNSFYRVKIDFEGDGNFENEEDLDIDEHRPIVECNCPYQGHGCKHVVAVLYYLLSKLTVINKQKSRLFENYRFNDVVRFAKTAKLVMALDIIRNGDIKIKKESNKFRAIVKDCGEYSVQILASALGKKANFIERCSCEVGITFDPCEHILATRIEILKKEHPSDLPNDFEERARENLEKETYDEFINKLEAKGYFEKRKKYKLFYGIEEIGDGIRLYVERSEVLKNGRLGKMSPITKRFVKNNYNKFNEEERRLFDLMFSRLNDDFYYNEENSRLLKHNFDGPGDSELLTYLREVYAKNPEAFINVEIPREKAMLELSFVDKKSGVNKRNSYLFQLKAKLGDRVFNLGNRKSRTIGKNFIWAYSAPETGGKGILIEIECSQPRIVHELLKLNEKELSNSSLVRLIEEQYMKLSALGNMRLPKIYQPEDVYMVPRPRLFLRDYGPVFCIELRFLYGDKEALSRNSYDVVFKNKEGKILKIKRNKDEEFKIVSELLEYSEQNGDVFLPKGDPLVWLSDCAQKLIMRGYEIYGSDSLLNFKIAPEKPELKLEVRSGIDWFDIKTELSYGKERVGIDVLRDAMLKHERFIRLSDGRIGIIPQKWLTRLGCVLGFLRKGESEESLRASHTQIQIIEALSEVANKSDVDENYKIACEKFKRFKGIKEMPLPKQLKGVMRDYQKAGYNWLHFLKEFSFGGCLADDMGLGKTVQILALLLYENENSKDKKISLVVVPTSLIFNWIREVEKFCPSLTVYVHHGMERLKNWKDINKKGADLILTTYGTLRNDIEFLKEREFHYIILDESQQIKNPLAKSTQSAQQLNGKFRLVLTGTPVENNYLELWSQFSFLNPGLLGTMEYFKDAFIKSMDGEKKSERAVSLRNIINPFLLMRKKENVASELPDKQITTLYCEMDGEQRGMYEIWREKFKNEIKDSITKRGFVRSRFKILEGLLRLRQICNHPMLVNESYMGESEKFNLVLEQIKEVVEEGHKVLVFSSFVGMLKLLRDGLDKEGVECCYLDGQTKNRKDVVDKFQNDGKIKAFLISIKAGGVGLNLTAADYVFIVDPWWNPAVEMQAIDRAHRIGQDKKVFVYKAITKDSVEEKILELQESKLKMVKDVIVSEEGIFKQLTPSDINYFFETREKEF